MRPAVPAPGYRDGSFPAYGEVSEWLKEHAWKACVGETLPWVRIPLSPPTFARPSGELRLGKPTRSLPGDSVSRLVRPRSYVSEGGARAAYGSALLTIHFAILVPYAPSSKPGRFNRS